MPSTVLKSPAADAFPRLEWRAWSSEGRHTAASAAEPPSGSPADYARIEKGAFDRGFREGEAAGAARAQEQFQAAVRAFAESAAGMAGYKASLRAEAEREMVVLALAVARKVVRRELSIDPDIVLAVVKACLEEIRNAEIYRLRLHPQDVQAVAAYLASRPIEVIPDPMVGRGGAVFETSQGRLDARLDSQLTEIERGLADGN